MCLSRAAAAFPELQHSSQVSLCAWRAGRPTRKGRGRWAEQHCSGQGAGCPPTHGHVLWATLSHIQTASDTGCPAALQPAQLRSPSWCQQRRAVVGLSQHLKHSVARQ